jgi:hypothetical protein
MLYGINQNDGAFFQPVFDVHGTGFINNRKQTQSNKISPSPGCEKPDVNAIMTIPLCSMRVTTAHDNGKYIALLMSGKKFQILRQHLENREK